MVRSAARGIHAPIRLNCRLRIHAQFSLCNFPCYILPGKKNHHPPPCLMTEALPQHLGFRKAYFSEGVMGTSIVWLEECGMAGSV